MMANDEQRARRKARVPMEVGDIWQELQGTNGTLPMTVLLLEQDEIYHQRWKVIDLDNGGTYWYAIDGIWWKKVG